MALYVIAITDSPIAGCASNARRLYDLNVDGIHVIHERRRAVPDLTDRNLRAQHRAVIQISRKARSILPVRFGALLAREELESSIRRHRGALRRALREVRDRVQMTTRVMGRAPDHPETNAASGKAYLEARRRLGYPELPPRAIDFLAAVRPLVVRERREPGAGGLLATFYHLVSAADVPRFDTIARDLGGGEIVTTGPWPPFAFTPTIA